MLYMYKILVEQPPLYKNISRLRPEVPCNQLLLYKVSPLG